MKSIATACFLSTLGLVSATPTLAFEQITGGTFQMVADVALSPDAKRSLNRFKRDNSAYGAYFAGNGGEDWSWYSGTFSLADAEKAARLSCEIFAKGPCSLVARVVPRKAVGDVAMPGHARKGLNEAVRGTTSGKFGAVAANGFGGWGTGFDFGSAADAQERALRSCAASSAEERANEDRDVVAVLDRGGVYDCRIVHVFQKN